MAKVKFLFIFSLLFFALFFYFNFSVRAGNIQPVGKEKVLIVLSPHFDDAVLSVGGIISEFDGPRYIVTFFGTPTSTAQYLTAWDKMSGFAKSLDTREARKKENERAAKIIGAKIINEDYVDFQYKKRTTTDSLVIQSSIEKSIDQILSSMGNALVTIIGPSYFGDADTHPDHLLLSKAFAEVIKNKNHPNATFYFYEDLPYAYGKFGNENVNLQKILSDFYPDLKFQKKVFYISKNSFDLKIKAIESYTSQMKAFDYLKEDLVTGITNFETRRCIAKVCEVVYQAK